MKRVRKNILFQFVFVLFASVAFGQDASFTATTSRSQVGVGEQFQITYTLNTSGGNFRAPDMHDFAVLSGPNQSTQMQYSNGSMSQSVAYSYIIAAQREGKFTIGAASIVVGGKQINSKSLTIEVVKNPVATSQQGQGSQGKSSQSPTNAGEANDLFIRVFVDKSKVYVGEQLTVTFKIYTKVSIVQNSLTKAPVFNGFWSEDVISPNQHTLYFYLQKHE